MKRYANNAHIPLTGKDAAWLIEKGAINIYAILHGGARHLLAHFDAGSCIFSWEEPLQDAAFEIKLVCEGEVSLLERSIDSVEIRFIEAWINAFTFFTKPLPDKTVHFLPVSGADTLPKGTCFQAHRANAPSEKSSIFWACLVRGRLALLADPKLVLETGALFPVSYLLWGECQEECQVEVFVAEKAPLSEGLHTFHRLLSMYVAGELQLQLHKDLERKKEKQKIDREVLHQTLTDMASLLHPKLEEAISPSKDFLFRSLKVIGKEMNIAFVAPGELPTSFKMPQHLIGVCQASHVRFRQIYLKPLWWKEESDPFLGFFGEDLMPVALLTARDGSYVMVDPKTLARQKVTPEIASQITSLGYTFYRSFPEELKSGREVLKFCVKNQWRDNFSLYLYGTVAALLSLIPPIVLSILYSKVIPGANLSLLFQLVFLLCLAAVSATVFTFFRSLILVRIEGKSSHEVQNAFWDRLLKLPASFFHRYSSGDLFFRLSSIEEIRTLISTKGSQAILGGVFSFFYLITMVAYSPKLTLWALGMIAVVSAMTGIAAFFKVRLERQTSMLRAKTSGALTQLIGAVAKLRVSGSEASAFSYWASLFTRRKKLEMQAQNIQNTVMTVNAALPFISSAIIFVIAIGMEKQNLLNTRDFLAFDAAFILFSMAIFSLSNTLLELTPVVSLWERAKVVLEEKEEVSSKKKDPGSLLGEISVDCVAFHYEERHPILRGLSLHIAPGEFVGIVGASGSGKSTLLRLLLGFEKPISGAVFFDSKDFETLDPREVRRQLGVVLQDTSLIAGSMYENIVCGGIFSKEDLERALELSGVAEDLENFPMGLHTIITSGGETMSGGQRQRLLIARALIAQPKILIFDEATSALDNKTQDKISHHIDQLEVTRVVVAHRLSTLKGADKIYVLDQGKIVQGGGFEALSKEEGPFKEMLLRQML